MHWFAKQRYLIDYTVAAMLRRRAKNVGLLAVYTTIVFLLASVMLYSNALKQEASVLLKEAPELVVQRMVAGRHDLIPADYLEPLRGIRGVRRLEGRLWGYFYDSTVNANYTFMVPPERDIDPGSIVIGDAIARARGSETGDVLAFRGAGETLYPFRVAEVLPHESAIVAADLVLLSEADFRGFFGIPPGKFTDITLTVANPKEVRTVAEKVVSALPDTRPILREEMQRTYASLFDWREGMVLVLLAGALLAFAILAWEKASGLSADERREIGILKAVGWGTGDVLKMKLWEGGLLSMLAFLLGFTLAYWHVFGTSAALLAPALKGWAVLYPNFELTPAVDGLQLTSLFVITVFPYTASTLVPVWRAAVTHPDVVMR
nr:FtsX-like permease family protein [Thiohalomonas denitrificans]